MIDRQTLLAELVHCPAYVTKQGMYVLYRGKWTDIDELREQVTPA